VSRDPDLLQVVGALNATGRFPGRLNVEACTVTALDAITAFAVPNPGGASQLPSVFSGLVALWVAPPS